MLELAYIGLGTNLGDRVQNIIEARNRLSNLSSVLGSRCSSLYLTSPVGYANQDDFVNCVLELQVQMTAVELFSQMQRIEMDLGRVRVESNQNAARVIDCDLLLFAEEKIQSLDLIVPHPRIQERLFVLEPLLELSPMINVGDLGQVKKLLDDGYRKSLYADQTIYRMGLCSNLDRITMC